MSGKMASFWLKTGETVLLVMAFLLPLAFYLRTYDSVMIKTTLFEAGVLALAFSWLFKGLERGRWEMPEAAKPLAAPALALLAWTLLRFALAPYKIAALPGFLRQLLYLVTFLIALLEFGGAQQARRLAGWILAAAWLAGLYGLSQHMGFDPFLWKGAFGERVFSTLGNPNLFGMFLALCVPLALAQWLDCERDALQRGSDLALLALIGANLVWTGSVDALMALAATGASCALLLPLLLPSKAALKAAALSLILAAAAATAMIALNGAALEKDLSYSLAFKRQAWRGTAAMIAQRPWTGHGPGSFFVHFPRFRPAELIRLEGRHSSETDHPECLLLETASELGLAGLALWAWLFGALAMACVKAQRLFLREGALCESSWLAGLSAAVLGFLAAAQFGMGSQFLMPGWLLWPLAGTLGGLTTLSRRGGAVTVLPLPFGQAARRKALAPAALVFLGLACLPAVWLKSDIEHNLAIYYSKRGEWDKALAHYERVRPGAQAHVMARYFMGNVQLDSGRPEEALKAYARVEALAPDYVLLHYQKALAYAKLGDWKNAMAGHERQRMLDPFFAENYARWAQAAKAAGELRAAERAALTAMALEPQNPGHRLALAEIHAKARRLAAARRHERKAAKLKRLRSGG